MRNIGQLRRVEDRLIKDLEESTLSLGKLGMRYGVSRQAIFAFCQRKRITRPRRRKTEHTKYCSICQSLLRIARRPHSDFISSQTIKKQLRPKWPTVLYHISILRKQGLISPKFGRLHSRKAELAYHIYFSKRLPVSVIGWGVGFKNFHSLIQKHRALGWDVPDPLFTYDSNDRSKAALKRKKAKRD